MSVVVRILVGLALLGAALLGGLALYLPRLVEGEEMRARLQDAARDATGRDVSWSELRVGLLPPRLVVSGPSMAGASPEAPPFAEAGSVELELALAPLLARVVVVDSLVVDGATLRLRRTEDGIELPRPPEKERTPRPPGERREPKDKRDDDGFALAVRSFDLKDARVLLEDVTVTPPVTWELSGLQGRVHATDLDSPVEFAAEGRLGSGGDLRVAGSFTLAGALEAALRLDGVETGAARPYLDPDWKLAGPLTGDLRLRRDEGRVQDVKANLVLEGGELALDDLALAGRIALEANLSQPGPAGPFTIDATQATLDYGRAFSKPAGQEATATGRLVPLEGGGYDVEEVRVELQNLDATGSVRSAPRFRAELSAPAFELAGWDTSLVALRGYQPAGRLGLDGLVLETEPLSLTGAIVLDDVALTPPGSAAYVLRGALEGRGGSVATRDLVLVAAGQPIGLAGSLDLAGEQFFQAQAIGKGLDLGALTRAYAGKDFIEGPLNLDAKLAGDLGGDGRLAQRLAGKLVFDVGRGRLHGVSLLKQSLAAIGSLAETALVANRLRGSDRLARLESDEFESISGNVDVKGGRAHTKDLRLVYRDYSVDLRGSMGLEDRSLDMTGEITLLKEAADETRVKVIPLTHVAGTVDSPRVDISPQALASLGAREEFYRKRGDISREIDERLGEGSGKAVTDVLEGFLKK